MKRILMGAVVIMMVVAMAGGAFAVGSMTAGSVTVQGTVIGKCKTDVTAATLNLGDLDPDSGLASLSPVAGSITMFCTKGYSGYTISAGSLNGATGDCSAVGGVAGNIKHTVDGTLIPYTFTCTKPAGAGFASAVDLVPTATIGSIPADATAGLHEDTVTVTVSW